MRRLLLSSALLAATIGTGVQNTAAQEKSGQMSIRVAGYEVLLNGEDDNCRRERRRDSEHWRRRNYGGRLGVLEVGFNNFRTYDNSYLAYPAAAEGFMDLDIARSVDITLNLSTFSTSLVRGNWLGISMGLGVTYDQYTLDMPMTFSKHGGMLHPIEPEHYLKRSKLRTLALHVPLVLEINPTRNFFLSAGGYADVVLWSGAKWKSPKEKFRNPYFNFIQAGLTARIGFRDCYIFGNYDLTELFETGKGPRLTPYTFGLGFGF